MKQCSSCRRFLPEKYFSKNQSYCKVCARDYRWQAKYGISPDEYMFLYQKQNGKCDICGGSDNEALQVDHCKNTGEVRGLLCPDCNKGLGLFRHNVEILDKAKEYLRW